MSLTLLALTNRYVLIILILYRRTNKWIFEKKQMNSDKNRGVYNRNDNIIDYQAPLFSTYFECILILIEI